MADAGVSARAAPMKTNDAAGLDVLYGPGASKRVANSNVLVVGAGGVGCEVVKNLAFAGFRRFTLVDLDTIDVSNLNRQFLFRRQHVSQPKAVTAAAAIQAMVPEMEITDISANIKDARFDITFFKTFTLVCNALDNLDARRHVNRMCLAASVPLIESGSTGYNGQVFVLSRDAECYDCTAKPPQKSYAVCTIRSTPEKPVHCVVWAKSLWDLIFGPDDDGNLLADLDGGGDVPAGIIEDGGDKAGKKPARRVRYAHPEPAHEFADRVCARVFVDDIVEQAAMKEMWTTRSPPIPFDVTVASEGSKLDLGKLNLLEQRVWEKAECARVLRAVLINMVETRHDEIGTVGFDKDDRDALAFVIAASNLRAHAYGVQSSTPFQIKGIAGNIVHAIATTNAMVGGLVVLEALKLAISSGDISSSLNTFVSRQPRGSRVRVVICPEKLQKPKPNCFVCSKGQLLLTLDTETTTLKMLIENLLMKKISALQPSISVVTGDFYNIIYECGQGLEDFEIEGYNENMSKSLAELRVNTGSQLNVEDLMQSLTCVIHVVHEKGCEADKPPSEQFILKGASPVADAPNGTSASKTGVHESSLDEIEDVDNDEVVFVGVPSEDPVREEGAPGKCEIATDIEIGKKNGQVTEDRTFEEAASNFIEATSVTPDEGSTDKSAEDEELKSNKAHMVLEKTVANVTANSEGELAGIVKANVRAGETVPMDVSDSGENSIPKKRKKDNSPRDEPQSVKRPREEDQ